MKAEAQLVLRQDPSKVAQLHHSTPTTIGRAEGNRLRLVSLSGVADHHAVVRFSRSQGWLVCDWQSSDGTFLEGKRIRQCRRLSDGDEIQLGSQGPVLVFRLVAVDPGRAGAEPAPARETAASADPGPIGASKDASGAAGAGNRSTVRRPHAPTAGTPPPASGQADRHSGFSGQQAAGDGGGGGGASAAPLTFGDRSIPLERIRSVHLRSRPRHPHSFSWWVLVCLGSMVLLPWPWLFWSMELGALVAWIVLGSRKEHELVLTLRDGMAHRHSFANRLTALSHRNGIRRAIGQSLESG